MVVECHDHVAEMKRRFYNREKEGAFGTMPALTAKIVIRSSSVGRQRSNDLDDFIACIWIKTAGAHFPEPETFDRAFDEVSEFVRSEAKDNGRSMFAITATGPYARLYRWNADDRRLVAEPSGLLTVWQAGKRGATEAGDGTEALNAFLQEISETQEASKSVEA